MASSGPGGDRQEFDWDLPVNVPTIGVHRTLRVTSNESVGAVMIKLASKLGEKGSYSTVCGSVETLSEFFVACSQFKTRCS